MKPGLSPHHIEIRTELHPVLLVVDPQYVRDVNTNVDHVDSLLYGEVKLVVVREDTEVPVGHLPVVLPTDQVGVGLSSLNALGM